LSSSYFIHCQLFSISKFGNGNGNGNDNPIEVGGTLPRTSKNIFFEYELSLLYFIVGGRYGFQNP
jgi:hypothetical protein